VQGGASGFGVSPWWSYVPLGFSTQGFLFPILLVATLIFWVKRPAHVLTWSTVPFVLIHLLVGHKEARFLFPMVFAQLLMALELFPHTFVRKVLRRWGPAVTRQAITAVWAVWLGANALPHMYMAVSMNSPRMAVLKALQSHPERPVYVAGQDPVVMCTGLRLQTFVHPGATFHTVDSDHAAFRPTPLPSAPWWVVRGDPLELKDVTAPPGCKLYDSSPAAQRRLAAFWNWLLPDRDVSGAPEDMQVYACDPP